MEKELKSDYNKDFTINNEFKKLFTKTIELLSVEVNIKDTDSFISKHKTLLFKHKMFSPVKKVSVDRNLIVLKFRKDEESQLDSILSDSSIKFDKKIHIVTLNYENFSLEECLYVLIPSQIVKEFPKSYEMIGNIAHMNLRDDFLQYKYLISALIIDVSINNIILKEKSFNQNCHQ